MADPSFHIHLLQFVIHKTNVKRSGPNVENKIEYRNLLKAICWIMMDNIFLSHSYIPPKSLFSITLTLICITLPLVKFLGERNVILFTLILRKQKLLYIQKASSIQMCCSFPSSLLAQYENIIHVA